MKLIIGLGNPGKKFEKNRHNAGHLFVDWILKQKGLDIDPRNIKFLKTDCFMNNSGGFVKKWVDFYKINLNSLYVVHDDLDLRLGKYKDPSLHSGSLRSSASPAGLKIQFGIGPKVHNGILSIENSLNTKDFWRIRIGIDNRNNQDTRYKIQGEDYVLRDFTDEELKTLERVFDAIIKDSSFPS